MEQKPKNAVSEERFEVDAADEDIEEIDSNELLEYEGEDESLVAVNVLLNCYAFYRHESLLKSRSEPPKRRSLLE